MITGILVGFDSEQEWMLPWFMQHYYDVRCKLPVAFVDFGMTADGLDQCRFFSDRIIRVDAVATNGCTWNLKPSAMLLSPFDRTIWMDNDCEMLSDPSAILDHLQPSRLAAAPDPYHHTACLWNTGVVAFWDAGYVLEQWAEASLAGHRGDQEALFHIRRDVAHLIDHLPQKFNRLRLSGPPQAGDVVYHWTGRLGKAHIAGLSGV